MLTYSLQYIDYSIKGCFNSINLRREICEVTDRHQENEIVMPLQQLRNSALNN